jgi:hypothetical protein
LEVHRIKINYKSYFNTKGRNEQGAILKPRGNDASASLKKVNFIGTQTGKCPLCKKTKILLLLRYGITLCEDCYAMLEQFELTT